MAAVIPQHSRYRFDCHNDILFGRRFAIYLFHLTQGDGC
jgi:hypothetical protein